MVFHAAVMACKGVKLLIIDKKRAEMYEQCRERKRELDKSMEMARWLLIVPPLAVAAVSLIMMFMHLVRGTLAAVTMAHQWGFVDMPPGVTLAIGLFSGAAFTIFAACLTVFRTPDALKFRVPVFICGIIIGVLFCMLVFTKETFFIVVYSVFAIPVSSWNEKLFKRDEEMSRLDGYPHFNPMLIRHRETPYDDNPVSTDDMTPDERIMYERSRGKGDEDRR